MTKRKLFFTTLCTLCTVPNASAFSLGKARTVKKTCSSKSSQSFEPITELIENGGNTNHVTGEFANSIAALSLISPAIVSAADDYEVAELPPVYVPVLFAIVIIGGVGVLTASLGDVMDEEAGLGLQSGARAKKERERSRSSYFKK